MKKYKQSHPAQFWLISRDCNKKVFFSVKTELICRYNAKVTKYNLFNTERDSISKEICSFLDGQTILFYNDKN